MESAANRRRHNGLNINRRWTLRIVPTSQRPGWSVTVSLKQCLFIGCFLLLALGATVVWTKWEGISRQEKLKTQLRAMKSRLHRLQANVQPGHIEWNELTKSVRNEFKRLQKRHREVLDLTGLPRLPLTELPEPDLNHSPMQQIEEWNRKLSKIQTFLHDRVSVFRGMPSLWPAHGRLSSGFGYRKDPMGGGNSVFHSGADVAAVKGTPVRAPASGRVIWSRYDKGSGNSVRIEHKYGYTSTFNHLSKRLVKDGERVEKGQLIGRVGTTGYSTGNHLHYEIQVDGHPINPLPYRIQSYWLYGVALQQE